MNVDRRSVTERPENSETPLEAISSWVTPTRLFFVRNHFDVPELDVESWRLRIEEGVQRPQAFSLADLEGMPQQSVLTTVECAGNGRSFLLDRVPGVQWSAGAIGHAEWTGVPLAELLERAGVEPGMVEVVFQGADRGVEPGVEEPIPFARSLPLEKALHRDTLVALAMNGEPLQANHGFPARLIVPGWYGVASVKWLTRISASAEPFEGFFQTERYTIERATDAGRVRESVRGMAVKSEVLRPREGDELAPGTHRVFGLAWAGERGVERVELSTDGGASWQEAELLEPRSRYSWVPWEFPWEVWSAGPQALLARATASDGETQPLEHDPLRGGYVINFVRPRRVQVRAAAERVERISDADAETLLYDMNAFAESNAERPLDVDVELIGGAGI